MNSFSNGIGKVTTTVIKYDTLTTFIVQIFNVINVNSLYNKSHSAGPYSLPLTQHMPDADEALPIHTVRISVHTVVFFTPRDSSLTSLCFVTDAAAPFLPPQPPPPPAGARPQGLHRRGAPEHHERGVGGATGRGLGQLS